MGLASHYRRFIRGFSTIAAPLTDLTKGEGPKRRVISWNDTCQAAFDELKNRLPEALILKVPDLSKPFIIETDASDFGIGAVLLQKGDDGQPHPLAYESKKLSAAERAYTAQERELLAILHALRQWRCFVDGSDYTIYTDHNPLRYLRTTPHPSKRLTRWLAEIESYDPDIRYKPGKKTVSLTPFLAEMALIVHPLRTIQSNRTCCMPL